MRKTLQHIHDKYDSVDDYMRLIGLSDEEINTLRQHLCKPGKVAQHSTSTDTSGETKEPEMGSRNKLM